MSDKIIVLYWGMVFGVFLGGVTTCLYMRSDTDSVIAKVNEYRKEEVEDVNTQWRDRLISQGLYEWRIDAKTGEREFVPVESGTEVK